MPYSLSPRPFMAPRGLVLSQSLQEMLIPLEPPKVLAVVEGRLREQLEAGIENIGTLISVNSVPTAVHAVRERAVRTVLISAKACPDDVQSIGRLVLRCAAVRAVAVLDDANPPTPNELLYLGACGVTEAVNLSHADGWHRLRTILADATQELPSRIYGCVDPVIAEVSDETRRFFQLLVWNAPRLLTIKQLGGELRINSSTLNSRFFRARLPLPKCYLAAMRLVYVRALLEAPSASIADVAYELRYSSPQSLGRHIRQNLGLTAGEFRREHSLAEILALYVSNLILSFRDTLKTFSPFGGHSTFCGNGEPSDRLIN